MCPNPYLVSARYHPGLDPWVLIQGSGGCFERPSDPVKLVEVEGFAPSARQMEILAPHYVTPMNRWWRQSESNRPGRRCKRYPANLLSPYWWRRRDLHPRGLDWEYPPRTMPPP